MLNLPHPDVLLAQINQGEIPRNWRVIRGIASPVKAVIEVVGMWIATVIVQILITILLKAAITLDINMPFMLWVLQLIVLGGIAWARARAGRDSLLILMPEGFMHFTNLSNRVTHAYTMYSYADISRIDIKTFLLEKARIRLKLQYLDGRCVTWDCYSWYGPPLEIARDIIAAHAQYTVLRTSYNLSYQLEYLR